MLTFIILMFRSINIWLFHFCITFSILLGKLFTSLLQIDGKIFFSLFQNHLFYFGNRFANIFLLQYFSLYELTVNHAFLCSVTGSIILLKYYFVSLFFQIFLPPKMLIFFPTCNLSIKYILLCVKVFNRNKGT